MACAANAAQRFSAAEGRIGGLERQSQMILGYYAGHMLMSLQGCVRNFSFLLVCVEINVHEIVQPKFS